MPLTSDEVSGKEPGYSWDLDVAKHAVLGGGIASVHDRARSMVDAGDAATMRDAIQKMPLNDVMRRYALHSLG